MIRPALALLAAVLLLGAAPSSRPAHRALDDQAVRALLVEVQQLPSLEQRIPLISSRLHGAPYAFSPLGEGRGQPPDEDPRFRVDRFDCTTFVETVVALSLAHDLDEARVLLDHLRYQDGKVSFATRKHFPEAQWIPLNIHDGFFTDITRQVGGDRVVIARKRLDSEVWAHRRTKILNELDPAQIPSGTFELPVIPPLAARQVLDRIPDGTVVSIVREDFKSIPIRVSHQGLLVRKKGVLVLRHAMPKGIDRVIDENFDSYLARIGQYGKWPVTGIHLLQP
ncbi:MAG: N-acetylmuramoyl-L-alanine amidase-like domain-containing protein, partial [Pseudomonadota bacterium]